MNRAFLALWIFAGLTAASTGADRGAQLAAACASCHRLDGRDSGIPSIIGMDEGKFAGIMQAFKSGARPGHIMRAVGLSLSDADIVVLAHYLGRR